MPHPLLTAVHLEALPAHIHDIMQPVSGLSALIWAGMHLLLRMSMCHLQPSAGHTIKNRIMLGSITQRWHAEFAAQSYNVPTVKWRASAMMHKPDAYCCADHWIAGKAPVRLELCCLAAPLQPLPKAGPRTAVHQALGSCTQHHEACSMMDTMLIPLRAIELPPSLKRLCSRPLAPANSTMGLNQ